MPNMYSPSPYGNPTHAANVNPHLVQPSMKDSEAVKSSMKDFCQKYHHHYVLLEAEDGHVYEGIIDGMDDDHVDMLVPDGDMEMDGTRQYTYGGYPYSGYGYSYPYGYPYGYSPYSYGYPRRFRRFRRRRFPFFGLRSFFFPFFF